MNGWVGYITNQSVINMHTTSFSSDAPSAHKRERRKEARPGELLDAALSLFVNKGFSATKVEDVAASAGVSKGTLFLYFSSKEDLFKAVIRANLADHFPAWNQEFEEFEGTTPAMLEYAMVSWWQRIGSTDASGITKLCTACSVSNAANSRLSMPRCKMRLNSSWPGRITSWS